MAGEKAMDSGLKNFAAALFRSMRWKAAAAVVLMVLVSLTEGFSLLMLLPLLRLVGIGSGEGAPDRVTAFLSSLFGRFGWTPTLAGVLGLFIFWTAAWSLLKYAASLTSQGLEYEFEDRLRRRLYRAIAGTAWLFFVRTRASDFSHVLTAEMERVRTAAYCLSNLAAAVPVTTVYVVLAGALSGPMTGIVLLCAGLLFLALRGTIGRVRRLGEGTSEAMSRLYGTISEHLGGMKTARSYGVEERHGAVFDALSGDARRLSMGYVRNAAAIQFWMGLGPILIFSAALYAAVRWLALPAAGLLFLFFLFTRLVPKLSGLQQYHHALLHELPAFARIMDVISRCEAAAEPRPEIAEEFEMRTGLGLEDVTFRYERGGEPAALEGIRLSVAAGETVAFVGPSGAGKSTLADLVMGLIVPDRGRVLVDGVPLGPARMAAWRAQIGYVAQETFLFHDTVRANLLWARPEAGDDDLRWALRTAALEDFVAGLPKGLETVLGDRGALVSGGERQRLALARALLRRPRLLILDEATSSLDSENERKIRTAIEELRGRMTILVISHRLSTVRGADRIHVLERGRLVESGTWDELNARPDGRLRALRLAQEAGD